MGLTLPSPAPHTALGGLCGGGGQWDGPTCSLLCPMKCSKTGFDGSPRTGPLPVVGWHLKLAFQPQQMPVRGHTDPFSSEPTGQDLFRIRYLDPTDSSEPRNKAQKLSTIYYYTRHPKYKPSHRGPDRMSSVLMS